MEGAADSHELDPPDSQDIWAGSLSATQTPEARMASGDKGL